MAHQRVSITLPFITADCAPCTWSTYGTGRVQPESEDIDGLAAALGAHALAWSRTLRADARCRPAETLLAPPASALGTAQPEPSQ